MRKFLLAIVALSLIAILSIQHSFGSHAMGANITYTCLGTNQYEVTLSFYRDCEGIIPLTSQTISVYSTSCQSNTTGTVTLLPGYPIEVSPLCPSQLPFSECKTNGTLPGVQEYVYRGIINLPFACSDWTFGFNEGYRNASITTLNRPGSTYLYLESVLNNLTYPCNNSPTFTNIPTPFVCVNQTYLYNHGAVDVDGDSLAYKLITPLGGVSSAVSFLTGYSGTVPVTSNPAVTINPLNGDISMHPTAIEIGVMAVRVEEYRNGILIGAVTRDIQITVLNCNNIAPTISPISNLVGGVSLGPQSIEVCANTPISFTIPGFDQDALDNLTMNWNNGIPGATFTPSPGTNPVSGVFTWTPTQANIGSNSFVVTLIDDACPIYGSSALAIDILVRDGTSAGPDLGFCANGGNSVQLGVTGGTSYSWMVLSGTPNSLNCTTCKNPVASPLVTTTYEVTTNLPCKPKDTVTVVVDPSFTVTTAGDTALCSLGGNVPISVTPSTPGAYTYLWTPAVGLSSTSSSSPMATPPGSQTYVVAITAPGGCVVYDSVTVDVSSQTFNVNPGASTDQPCAGDPLTLYANVDGNNCDTYVAVSVPYARIIPSGPSTTVNLFDETVSSALPLGFSFNFYCNDYTNVYLSDNGWLSFDPTSTSDPDWSNDLIPTSTPVNNMIAFAWDDHDPSQGGTIEYFTEGTAPNRKFVLNFDNIEHYSCSNCLTSVQVVLNEGTNIIDIHSTRINNASGENKTQGIENANGTKGVFVPGRNRTAWSTLADSWRFTRAAPGSYQVVWHSPLGSPIGTGDSLVVTPGMTTNYVAVVTDLNGGCDNSSPLDVDVAWVDAGPDQTIFYGDTANIDGTYWGPPASYDCNNYAMTSIPYSWESGATGTLNISTNGVSGNVNLGFSFDFYCTTYTSLVVAEDGWVSFTRPGGDNSSDPIPTVSAPNGIIAAAWDNLKQRNFSNITYRRSGVAPFRKFSVTWDEVVHYTFSGGGNRIFTQIVLYEGSNVIEINNQRVDSDGQSNTVQGIESPDGRNGIAVPGRNQTAWSVSSNNPDSWRFTPPPTGIVYSWSPGLHMNDSTLEDPKASPQVPTYYVLTVDNGTCVMQDSMLVIIRPLPVELLSFTTKRVDDFVMLNWETETEVNSDYFIIEKSIDGMIFDEIGLVGAAGNSQGKLTYEYLDTNPYIGENYYRLKIVDKDGSVKHSNIESWYFETVEENRLIAVYPNPSEREFNFDLNLTEIAPVRLKIIGMDGRVVHSQQIVVDRPGLLTSKIDLGNLTAGVYLYQIIINRDGFTGKINLIK